MENEIVEQFLTAKQIKAQVNRIQEVMAAVMKDKVHYGTIPGCGDKPTLLKPGAEKIMATFRLTADPVIDDLSTPDIVHYRVTVKLASRGEFVGAGIGECSSEEEKYHWKKAVCEEEFLATPEDRRREKWTKGYQGAKNYTIKQIMTNKADVANTVLKMAKKRALVDAVLTATAASDIFAQDLEDLPPEIAAELSESSPAHTTKPAVDMPKAKQPSPDTVAAAFNVLDAMAQPVDSMISVWGVFFDYKVEQVGKNKRDITRYKLSPREGTQLITISRWGKVQEGLALGDVIQINKVLVKEYQGEKQYLGEEIVVIEKAQEETNA